MSEHQTVTFQSALESVEALPGHQQDDLVEIIRRRRLEQRRDAIASRIAEAKRAHTRGEVSRGSVADFMHQIEE